MGLGMGFSLSAAVQPNPPPWSILGLSPYAWLRADVSASITLVSSKVSSWADQSGNGRDFTQGTAGIRPVVDATYINGSPAIKGNGVDRILAGPDMSSVATAGSADVFIVMRLDVDPPVTGSGGCWKFNNGGSEDYFEYAGNALIYSGIFSTARKATGVNPGTHYFETPRLVEVHSAAGLWELFLNGASVYSTGTNTVQGCSAPSILGWTGSVYMLGGIAELLIFAPGIGDADRALVRAELASRWGLVL